MKLVIEEKDVGLEIDLNEVRASIRPHVTKVDENVLMYGEYELPGVAVVKNTPKKKPGRKSGKKTKVVHEETFPMPVNGNGEHQ